ncbi:MAG: hypothetical protein Q9171_005448 [Xanthocarpia ochracea]
MSTRTAPDDPAATPSPSIFRWTLGFLLVGMAWAIVVAKGPTGRNWDGAYPQAGSVLREIG